MNACWAIWYQLRADLNRVYIELGKLNIEILNRCTAWLDTGTFDDLNDASNFVSTIEHRQGINISCPRDRWCIGFMTDDDLQDRATGLTRSGYGTYLLTLLDD